MANKVVALNQTDVSLRIRILADATGVPNTGITNSTTGFDIWYQRGENTAAVSGGASTNDLAAVTSAHTDWGIKHIIDGFYRIDLPDAAFAEGVTSVTCGVSADAFTSIPVTVDIEPMFKFQGQASSVTSTTTTFPSGTTPLKGDIIMVVEGTGEPGNQVLVTSATGEVATHAAFETGISATTSTILLIAGDSVTADGGINCDAATSDAATPTEVNAECDTAIADADFASLIATEVAAAFSSGDIATQAKLLAYVQLLARSDSAIASDNSTELSEINTDEGSGAGNYANTTDSLEHGNVKRIANGSALQSSGTGNQEYGE